MPIGIAIAPETAARISVPDQRRRDAAADLAERQRPLREEIDVQRGQPANDDVAQDRHQQRDREQRPEHQQREHHAADDAPPRGDTMARGDGGDRCDSGGHGQTTAPAGRSAMERRMRIRATPFTMIATSRRTIAISTIALKYSSLSASTNWFAIADAMV